MRAQLSLAAACLWAIAGTTVLAAAPTLVHTILAGLARTPPATTPFVEVSYRAVLARPLVVSGTLRWPGGERLERHVTEPFTQTSTIDDGEVTMQRGHGRVHRVPLTRVPQAGALLAGFRALLGGNVAALGRNFALSAAGSRAHWVVTMVPRTDQFKRYVASIVVDGRAADPRCLTVHDANGDATITLLGALARAGLHSAAPQEAAVAARCRSGP